MEFQVALKQFPKKDTPFSVSNIMVNAGAAKTLFKLMLNTESQANVSQQWTKNSNHATTIQMRRVLELHEQIISTKSPRQVNSKNNDYRLNWLIVG